VNVGRGLIGMENPAGLMHIEGARVSTMVVSLAVPSFLEPHLSISIWVFAIKMFPPMVWDF